MDLGGIYCTPGFLNQENPGKQGASTYELRLSEGENQWRKGDKEQPPGVMACGAGVGGGAYVCLGFSRWSP